LTRGAGAFDVDEFVRLRFFGLRLFGRHEIQRRLNSTERRVRRRLKPRKGNVVRVLSLNTSAYTRLFF
jgi:hypothetical protein